MEKIIEICGSTIVIILTLTMIILFVKMIIEMIKEGKKK